MAASTVDELVDALDACFQWRRTELAALRTDVERTARRVKGHPPRDRMVLRAAVALIYAHWEGFVKDACQHYLDFVARRKLRYRELSDPFLHTSLRRMIAGTSTAPETLAKLTAAILTGGEGRAHMSRHGIVDTRSNLRYETVCGILSALGLPLGVIETREQLINRKLCDARNAIAHGRSTFPDRDDVLELHRQVLEMMEHLRHVILEAVDEGAYRRSPVPPSTGGLTAARNE